MAVMPAAPYLDGTLVSIHTFSWGMLSARDTCESRRRCRTAAPEGSALLPNEFRILGMIEAAMRGFARAFCDALTLREPQRIAPFLHDDVDWIGFGPVDLFPFLGRRKGAPAVIALCGDIADTLELTGFTPRARSRPAIRPLRWSASTPRTASRSASSACASRSSRNSATASWSRCARSSIASTPPNRC